MESWGYGIPTPINEQDWDPVGYTMGMKQAITDAGGDPEALWIRTTSRRVARKAEGNGA